MPGTAKRAAGAGAFPGVAHEGGSRPPARTGYSREASTALLACRDALSVYDDVVEGAELPPPTPDNAVGPPSLALALCSGTDVLPDRPPGRRAELLESLGRLSAEPGWTMARARRTGGREPAGSAAPDGSRSSVRPRPARCAPRWWLALLRIESPSRRVS